MTAPIQRWQSSCNWAGCTWTTTGSEQWARAAAERHTAEHRATYAAQEIQRAARYRWRGHPNPTQQRLIEQVRAGSLAAHSTLIHTADRQITRWYPSNISRRDQLWWPALEEAGLVVARPTWNQGRQQTGVWQLTAAGRRVAQEVTA